MKKIIKKNGSVNVRVSHAIIPILNIAGRLLFYILTIPSLSRLYFSHPIPLVPFGSCHFNRRLLGSLATVHHNTKLCYTNKWWKWHRAVQGDSDGYRGARFLQPHNPTLGWRKSFPPLRRKLLSYLQSSDKLGAKLFKILMQRSNCADILLYQASRFYRRCTWGFVRCSAKICARKSVREID